MPHRQELGSNAFSKKIERPALHEVIKEQYGVKENSKRSRKAGDGM